MKRQNQREFKKLKTKRKTNKKEMDRRMDILRTCELCKESDDIYRCSQEIKDNFYVDQLVQHEIRNIQTQNRFQLFEQSDAERPKSVQSKI